MSEQLTGYEETSVVEVGAVLDDSPADAEEVYLRTMAYSERAIAAVAAKRAGGGGGGGSLPIPWTADNTTGEVTAAVDDGAKTPLTLAGLNTQSASLLEVSSPALGAYIVVDSIGTIFACTDGSVTQVNVTDDGPSSSLDVTILGTVVTIHLATDSGDTPTSTWGEIQAAAATAVPALQITLLPGFDDSSVPVTEGNHVLGSDRETNHFRVSQDSSVLIQNGDPTATPLAVHGAGDAQTAALLDVTCGSYGLQINQHGCSIFINDADNDIVNVYVNDGNDLAFAIRGAGEIDMPLLPTADPHVAGRLWSSTGTLKVSAG